MKVFSTSIKEKLKRLDFVIIGCAVGMTALSVLTLYGAKDNYAYGQRMFIIQSFAALLGLVCMVIISLIDYDALITKFWIPIIVLSVALIGAVLVLGDKTENQTLYISIGPLNLQVSEFVKSLFILSFAKHLDLLKEKINNPHSLVMLAAHAGLIIGMMLITGDLGSTLVFMAIAAFMLFAAGLSLWYYVGIAGALIIATPYIWPHLSEYQQMRILCGFDPEIDPMRYGYQSLRSREAISAGGFWGAGIMGGSEYLNIPVATTDFLFSVLCEKLGFFGALVYIILMCTMIFRIVRIARTARKDAGAFICVGVAAILITQTTENMGMCLAMLPVIGITMPFISYGGSSMLAIYCALGLVQSVRLHNEKYFFEREDA